MSEAIDLFWAEHSATLMSVGYKAFLSLIILVVSLLVGRGVKQFIRGANHGLARVDATLVPVLGTTAAYAVYTIGAVFILDIFGVNTASLITLLGAAGLAIGLALKDTLSNIAAGIMLLVLRPFRTGDFVECGSITGSVKEINLFTTVLETADGLYVASPNSLVWGSTITNFTRNGKRRMDLVVGIAYSDSIEAGLQVLQHIADTEPRFLQDPLPQVMVQSLGDSSVNLQLRGWASTEDYWKAWWDLNRRVKEEIEQAGLTIPFPQRDLHLPAGWNPGAPQ